LAAAAGGAILVVGALYGTSLLMAQPRIAADTGRQSAAMAPIAEAGSTRVIVSAPNSNDCRGFTLNVVTGERGDKGRVDCNSRDGKPGRVETIAQSFRNR
jgi:hypothetical protein